MTHDDPAHAPGLPEPCRPTIRSPSDLGAAWRRLLRPLAFASTSLWLMLVQPDDTPVPHLVEIAGGSDRPRPEDVERLTDLLRHLLEERPAGTRWAVLRSRPGPGGVSPADRAWATLLHASCARAGVPLEPFHLATDDTVRAVPLDGPDDLDGPDHPGADRRAG